MNPWLHILGLTLLPGLAMPLGGLLASREHIHPRWLETELRHAVLAFGAGALLAAVALVLVPEGMRGLPIWLTALCFAGGGALFMLIDRLLAAHRTSASQAVDMLLDYIPETLALGAAVALGSHAGLLLAGLMALQNLPEGFNAYREMHRDARFGTGRVLGLFTLIALLGPLAGICGYLWLAPHPEVVSAIMLCASGGILYSVFQDIAPQVRLQRHWAPPLGAVAGFLLGMIGQSLGA
ncbi:ZIP family metal transporter [Pseudomonas oryzae]|uniref:Zinc transporter, ZIP family n=1 Tax=Pseudomonas oryzae TaxID=1392877 RepID=A0A1H1UX90_9PSED|nr:divalent cation transporter [Pseudomonas oryzae]SDS77115.1 zinc transporter, ZIP family [Pseudomonas oryzae]